MSETAAAAQVSTRTARKGCVVGDLNAAVRRDRAVAPLRSPLDRGAWHAIPSTSNAAAGPESQRLQAEFRSSPLGGGRMRPIQDRAKRPSERLAAPLADVVRQRFERGLVDFECLAGQPGEGASASPEAAAAKPGSLACAGSHSRSKP